MIILRTSPTNIVNYFVQQKESEICDSVVGYLAVYRICFAMAAFFFFFCLIMYGVKSSKDPRSGIQNGFWGIKVLIYIGLIVGAFFIPTGTFIEGNNNLLQVTSALIFHFFYLRPV